MNLKRICLLFLLICWVALASFAEQYYAEVISVVDGDTLEVLHQGKTVRIRLYGIDSPEKGQPFGTKAKTQLSSLAFGKIVIVEKKDFDSYGRTVAEIRLKDGTRINREMVSSGYAWWFEKYAPDDTDLKQREAEARSARRGLWSDPQTLEPWLFREKQFQ